MTIKLEWQDPKFAVLSRICQTSTTSRLSFICCVCVSILCVLYNFTALRLICSSIMRVAKCEKAKACGAPALLCFTVWRWSEVLGRGFRVDWRTYGGIRVCWRNFARRGCCPHNQGFYHGCSSVVWQELTAELQSSPGFWIRVQVLALSNECVFQDILYCTVESRLYLVCSLMTMLSSDSLRFVGLLRVVKFMFRAACERREVGLACERNEVDAFRVYGDANLVWLHGGAQVLAWDFNFNPPDVVFRLKVMYVVMKFLFVSVWTPACTEWADPIPCLYLQNLNSIMGCSSLKKVQMYIW
jgi:hypothetical protein